MTITGAGRSACERCRVLMPIADLLPYSRIAAAAAPKRFLSLCVRQAKARQQQQQLIFATAVELLSSCKQAMAACIFRR